MLGDVISIAENNMLCHSAYSRCIFIRERTVKKKLIVMDLKNK